MKILKNVFFSIFILLIFTNNSWSKSASEFSISENSIDSPVENNKSGRYNNVMRPKNPYLSSN